MTSRVSLALAAALLALALVPATAAAYSPAGKWTVTTRLVAASDPINKGYEVGDKRRETWRITVRRKSRRRSTLRSPVGRIKGRRVGKAWRYDSVSNLTEIEPVVKLKVHLVLRQTSRKRFKGTIEASYWDPRYARGGPLYDPEAEKGREAGVWHPTLGLKLGLDAWRFTGRLRR